MSVDVTKLPSGLTVITDTMPHLETAALGVWAGVGGRDEKPNEHGISHLLEHMAFKGTTRRSSREIVEEIEAVGGDLNAGKTVTLTLNMSEVVTVTGTPTPVQEVTNPGAPKGSSTIHGTVTLTDWGQQISQTAPSHAVSLLKLSPPSTSGATSTTAG